MGVDRAVSSEEIKKAYKKKALILHPDKNCDTPEIKEYSEKQFKILGEAYSTLYDQEKRNTYNLTLKEKSTNSWFKQEKPYVNTKKGFAGYYGFTKVEKEYNNTKSRR